jgi:hypothetical protein
MKGNKSERRWRGIGNGLHRYRKDNKWMLCCQTHPLLFYWSTNSHACWRHQVSFWAYSLCSVPYIFSVPLISTFDFYIHWKTHFIVLGNVMFEQCSDKRNNLYCKYTTREIIPFASTTAVLIKGKAL